MVNIRIKTWNGKDLVAAFIHSTFIHSTCKPTSLPYLPRLPSTSCSKLVSYSIFNDQDNFAIPSTNPESKMQDKPPEVQEEKDEEFSAKIEEINNDLSSLTMPVTDFALIEHQQAKSLQIWLFLIKMIKHET